ncbi:MAG: class 1 fructose-bisphosphatase [Bacteroidia bacterium]|nr:MAG: class 1 fructose-bisphosphatase [Bacteroidia bacterium]
MGTYRIITLNQFIIDQQADFPYATGEFSRLLYHLAVAAKIVNKQVNKAGLVDILGEAGTANIQGEEQKKLDVLANEQFIIACQNSGECCGIASEENQSIVTFDSDLSKNGNYIVCMDPLDGSSNIDVNVSIGTIFSVYRRISPRGGKAELGDFLQPGSMQCAAGYVIYGSSTMLVYTTGKGVYGFTLDPSIGEFCLSHRSIVSPQNGSIYSVNEGYVNQFSAGVREYIKRCQEVDPAQKKPYKARYIGSLVADFHRNLLKGGIYIYPATESAPSGKLRLLYECNPMALLVEQAGGKATTGRQRILDIVPETLHQRTPLIIGSTEMVDEAVALIEKYDS